MDPGGRFSDYIAFYFGARSPMLYNIYHGFNDVPKRPQEEIIYIIATFEKILEYNYLMFTLMVTAITTFRRFITQKKV